MTQDTNNAMIIPVDPKSLIGGGNDDAREQFIGKIREMVSGFEANTETQEGRDAIKSFAYKITRTKTAFDQAYKDTTEDARKAITLINTERNNVVAVLEALATSARLPLTNYDKRIAEIKQKQDAIIGGIKRTHTDAIIAGTLEAMQDASKRLDEILPQVTEELFGDLYSAVMAQFAGQKEKIIQSVADIKADIAAKAELEQLRADKARRDAEDEKKRLADEAAKAPQAPEKTTEEISPKPAKQKTSWTSNEDARHKQYIADLLGQAKEDLMKSTGFDEPTAKACLLAIYRKQIRNISFNS